MAWTAPRTWTTGELVTASMFNTGLRDNLLATGVATVTTAGDITYATGANALARLAAVATGQVIRSAGVGVAPAWGKIALICRATTTTVQAISDSTFTAMLLELEDTDPDGMHSTSSNTSRITVPRAGLVIATGSIRFAANATGSRRAAIRLNGTTYINENQRPAGSSVDQTIETTAIWNTSANDYFEIVAWQNSGGSLNTAAASNPAYTFLQVILL